MNAAIPRAHAALQSCSTAVATHLTLALITLLLFTGVTIAQAQVSRDGAAPSRMSVGDRSLGAAVNIDGNLQDMINYAGTVSSPADGCSFVEQDPAKDIRIFDPKIIPCVPIVDNYYVNGFDQVLDVLAYDRDVQTLYLGIRTAGVIGDPDGNGDPNSKCPAATFDDEVGIGFDDSYKWEINVDCAGAPEITIEVRDNQITLTGAAFTTKTYAANGTDLEVAITGLVLPPAYQVRVFSGNISDGLGEDIHLLTCAPPGPQIVVDKTANPERICPGANTTFTVVVTNPGVTPLQTVSLVDALPAGLTYVNGSSNSNCGVGQPNVNGQTITWPNFALAPGASCTITFQAQASAQCLGPQVNTATATGSFTTACFQGGEPQVVQDSDDATVTCAPLPCVSITEMVAPASACANGPVVISGTVQNCSPEAETIVVTLNGGAPQNLGSVAGGASANFSFNTTMGACTAGQNVQFTVVATATNECGQATDTESRNVRCDAPPCVNITDMSAPAEACPNTQITISGSVQNCSIDPETIIVTLNGGAPQNLGVVPAGGSVPFSFQVSTGECTAGQQLAYTVVATATNACGEASDSETRNVRCKALPCVTLSALEGPASACAGAPVVISGSVTNCSIDPETIVVTLNGGAPQNLGVVAGGASANFSFNTNMGKCTAGQNVAFTVLATATNDCGEATDTETKNVRCDAEPCVNITEVQAPAEACPNTPIVISGSVQNCSVDPETIVVTLNGGAPQNLGTVAPGATANFSFPVNTGECTAGQNLVYTLVATATNACGTATDTEVRNVRCKALPCVNILDLNGPASACQNTNVQITGSVQNCSLDPETIVVTINGGQQQNLGVVAAGATQPFSFTVNMGNCVAGQNVPFVVEATATNDCGTASDTETHNVLCKVGPCVNITDVSAPAEACPNAAIVISGTVQNCGQDPETIVVTLNGGAPQNLGVVQPGASVNFSFNANMGECTAGAQVPFTVVATATNDCGEASDTETRNVRCKALPCVNLSALQGPDAACANAPIVISGTATNCSLDPETIVVTLNGGAPQNLGVVAGGASVNFSFNTNMGACTAGQQVAFTVVATATNDCGEATDSETKNVRCNALPCVNITDMSAPASACQNAEISISGTVQNCSIDPETIVVSLNGGAPQNLGVVAPGASANFSFTVNIGNCTAGENVSYTVVATATNECGEATDSESRNVLCKVGPCIDITAMNAPEAVCPNSPISITGTVQNCGGDAEQVSVSLNGGAPVNLGTVAAGATANFQFEVNSGECTAGQQLAYTVVATATNDCGSVTDSETRNVRCKALPCVNITAMNVPASACVNAQVEITGTVQNCSGDPETIVVSLNGGAPQNLGVVAAGASANFSFVASMGACQAGQNVAFTVVATATNDCGEATDTEAKNVLCKVGPCVELTANCSPEFACPGTPVTVSGQATNCSADAETIVVTYNGQSQNLGVVQPGQSAAYSSQATMGECTPGQNVTFAVSALATNDCGEASDEASCSVECRGPQIDVENSAEAEVASGDGIHYVITLTNPSQTVALENIELCADLCSGATWVGDASPAPASQPANGAAGGTVCWNIPSLAPGASMTFTYTMIAVGGGEQCTDDVTCHNVARAHGFCGSARADDEDAVDTLIPCERGLCRFTGGGTLNENGDGHGRKQHSFGGNVSPCPTGDGTTGDSWQHIKRDGNKILFNFHSWEPCITSCSIVPPGPCSPNHGETTRADWSGPAKYSLGSGSRERDAYFEAVIIDHNEGACNRGQRDEYGITVWDSETNEIVFHIPLQETDTGNLQIHHTPRRLFAAPGTLPAPVEGQLTGVELLGRPYPNPFGASMSFGYEVPSGDAQAVEIGVYNVAGRLITRLASEVQSPGRYTVRWDGKDAAGVSMAPGVYFLKSKVGQAESTSRLLKIAQ